MLLFLVMAILWVVALQRAGSWLRDEDDSEERASGLQRHPCFGSTWLAHVDAQECAMESANITKGDIRHTSLLFSVEEVSFDLESVILQRRHFA